MQRVKVAVVEDHTLFAESLVLALGMEGYDVKRIPLGEPGRDISTLLPSILRSTPRVVILDLDLGSHGNGARLVEPLTRSGTAVLVVTGNTERSRWGEAIAHGARRVLPKSAPLNDIAASIRKVSQGLPVLDREERAELMRAWHAEQVTVRDARAKLERLTRRESEVLGHFLEGRQVKEIAQLSVVSEATVRTQVKSILAKLEVSSQIAAVGLARRARWSPPHA
ncbi:LuxR C-terminal-related transcriptional regulator [Nocardioides daejeonensis]|uniref:LuxR C-terminal-related transcriptional regulator n=1 Tax=Nocardioides daejeonensis TaxID=1046556 RepID=UPI000D74B75D|nr:response regulator transcription factor [Nocardioides daejeonensis]